MFPYCTFFYRMHMRQVYSKFFCYLTKGSLAVENFEDRCFCQLRRMVFGSKRSIWKFESALSNTISRIIFFSSQKQMLGIYARRIVAFVKYKQITRYFSVESLIRKSMSHEFLFSRQNHKPISKSASSFLPRPAIICITRIYCCVKLAIERAVKFTTMSAIEFSAALYAFHGACSEVEYV